MTGCWVDGVECEAVPATDRGLMYGDGVFETVGCRDGAPRFLELHLRRLQAGCRALGLPEPDLDRARIEIRRAAAIPGPCVVRLTMTRGSSPTRGYAPPVPCVPRRIVMRYADLPGASGASGANGIRACLSTVTAGASPALAGIKHLNRLENVLARARLAGTGFEEAVMATVGGELVGGTMSNLFVVLQGRLVTPPIVVAGVRGVMRAVVLREAAASGIETAEQPLRLEALSAASEVFFTNSRIGLWPVRALEGWQADVPGPLVRALRQRIDSLRD